MIVRLVKISLLGLLLLALSTPVIASDISAAQYTGRISIVNSGGPATNVVAVMDAEVDNFIDGDMLNVTATDLAIQNVSADVPFMPGYNTNPWILYAGNILGYEQRYNDLYTGSVTGGKIVYFPGTGGMTTADSPSLELGDVFEIEVKAYVNTAINDVIVNKPNGGSYVFGLRVTPSGEIYAAVVDVGVVSVTSDPLPPGEYVVRVTADGTNMKLYINGVEEDSAALAGNSVPDTADDWVAILNNVCPYVEYLKITVSGVLQQHITWQYGATFTDLSGNSHTATPTFRTTSSADISAELVSFGPRSTSSVPSSSSAGAWSLITTTIPAPAGLYSELNMTFLGAGLLTRFTTVTGVPISIPVFIYCFGISMLLGLLVYRLTMGRFSENNPDGIGRKGSLFAQAIVSGLIMTYFVIAGGGVIPGWTLIPFAIEAITLIMIRQQPFGVGG